MDICTWVMGIAPHCAEQDAFVAIDYDTESRCYLTCSPHAHPDDVMDQVEHLVQGVYEGLATA